MSSLEEAYRQMVLAELKRNAASLETIRDQLFRVREEVAALKVKAGIWGVLGGAAPAAIALLYTVLSK